MTEATWHKHQLVNSSLPTICRGHLLKEPSMTIPLPDLRRRPTLYFSFKPWSTVTNEWSNYFLCLFNYSVSCLGARLLPALFPPPHLYPTAQRPARGRSSLHTCWKDGWHSTSSGVRSKSAQGTASHASHTANQQALSPQKRGWFSGNLFGELLVHGVSNLLYSLRVS